MKSQAPITCSRIDPMPYAYDDQNVFARILRGEIPNDTVLETAHSLAFNDIAPQAPGHVLLIPKGAYVNFGHFCEMATPEEIADFNRAAAQICAPLTDGYRVISNAGAHGMQEVPHYHLHILSGRVLGPLIQR